MEKPSVLEDENASSFGAYIDSLLSLPVKERSCTTFKLRCWVILDGVIEVQVNSVEGLKLFAWAFSIVERTVTVGWNMLGMNMETCGYTYV